jgi:hypothetical protein
MSDRFDNTWLGGEVTLVCPPLDPQDIGSVGARFIRGTFDSRVGEEWFLGLLDHPEWAERYGAIKEMTLVATTMALMTSAGPAPLVLWKFAVGAETFMHQEQFIDVLHEGTRRMLSQIESQRRLKVILRNNRTGETGGFWEFENNFGMDEFAQRVCEACRGMPVGSFDERVVLAKAGHSVEELIRIAGEMELP